MTREARKHKGLLHDKGQKCRVQIHALVYFFQRFGVHFAAEGVICAVVIIGRRKFFRGRGNIDHRGGILCRGILRAGRHCASTAAQNRKQAYMNEDITHQLPPVEYKVPLSAVAYRKLLRLCLWARGVQSERGISSRLKSSR